MNMFTKLILTTTLSLFFYGCSKYDCKTSDQFKYIITAGLPIKIMGYSNKIVKFDNCIIVDFGLHRNICGNFNIKLNPRYKHCIN